MSERISVNLTPRGRDALDRVCGATRETRTEIISRALVVYGVLLDLQERSGGSLVAVGADGAADRIYMV